MPRVMLQESPRDRSAYGGWNHQGGVDLIVAGNEIEARCLELAMLSAGLTSKQKGKGAVCRI
jgi:hypothetical protein